MLLVSLNAMRAGLLTRFLGILGVVAGVVSVFPQLMPLPLVQSFWLVALGLMLLGRTAVPPAWRTGNAEPWPSAKDSPSGGGRPRIAVRASSPRPSPSRAPAAKPHPASSKKRSAQAAQLGLDGLGRRGQHRVDRDEHARATR